VEVRVRVVLVACEERSRAKLEAALRGTGNEVAAGDRGWPEQVDVVVVDGIVGAEAGRWTGDGRVVGRRVPVIAGVSDVPGGVEPALAAGVADVYPAGDAMALRVRLAVLAAAGSRDTGASVAVAHANDAMYALGLDGRLLWVNAAAERMTGYRREELTGMHLERLVRDAVDRERVAAEMRAKAEGEVEASLFEVQMTTAGGDLVPVEVSSRLVERDGRPWAIEGVARDLRPRRRLEEHLHRQAEVFAQLGVAAIALDREGRVISWNREAERLFGLAAAETLGTVAFDGLAGPVDEVVRREFARALGGESVVAEYTLNHADGSAFSALVSGAPLRDEVGAVVGVVGAVVDVSAERARQGQLSRLAAVVASSDDAITTYDLEGTITEWNAAAERIYGRAAHEVRGLKLWELAPPGEEEARRAFFERVIGGEVIAGLVVPREGGRGVAGYLSLSAFPVRDEAGRITGAAAVARDITAQVVAERGLREREATMRSMFESTGDHLWLLDREGRLVTCSTAAAGFALERAGRVPAPGDLLVDLLDAEARPLLQSSIEAAMGGRTVQGEMAVKNEDGPPTYVNVQVTPVRGDRGTPIGVLVAARDVTEEGRAWRELQRAREALAGEYAKLSTIIENSDEGIILLDRECRLVAFNSEFAAGTRERRGVDPKPGMHFGETVSPQSREALLEQVREALRGNRVAFEVQSQSPGQRRWFEVRIRPVVTEAGEVTGVVYTGRDVTERRELEQQAREAHANYRAVVEHSADAIFVIDVEGGGVERTYRVAMLNQAFTALTGLDGERARGRDIREVLGGPAVVENAVRRYEAAMAAGTITYEEALPIEPPRWVSVTMTALYDGDGRCYRLIGSARDMTEKLARERELAETAADLAGTLGAIHEGVALIQADGVLLAVNRSVQDLVAEMFGTRPEPGMHWSEVVPEVWQEAFAEVVANTLAGEQSSFELKVADRLGAERWLEFSWGRVKLANGTVRGVALSLRDITERRQTEERLLQAQKAESLAVLAGGIAHDFNNLLVGILGNAGLALAELPPGSSLRATIEEIELAGQRAADLARQVLAYAGRAKLEMRPINLNGTVEEIAQLLRLSVGAGVRLVVELAPGLPPVVGDATQLRQVVMNLVLNGSDAIGGGEGTVRITTTAVEGTPGLFAGAVVAPRTVAPQYVVLEVADTGSGMDEGTLARIFDPFFTTKFAGRGLGLAAVLGIVRGHRGGIDVQSEPGEGTRFRVMLPASPEPGGDEPAPGATATWRGVGTVLVADDEPSVRAVTSRALRLMGFDVIEAGDGQAAVELFDEHRGRLALVLLDMTMPRLSGGAAYRAIRERDPGARVVLMSGYTEQDATEHFAGGGLAGFLQKPYELAALREVVRRAIEGEPT
jgi:PAS domain S-box-containing protein